MLMLARRSESCSRFWPLSQLIRGGFDSIINLIFRLFFSKRRPAITLEDPNIKYALRLIDKQVTHAHHNNKQWGMTALLSSGLQTQQMRSSTTVAFGLYTLVLIKFEESAVCVWCLCRSSAMTRGSSASRCPLLNTSSASPSVSTSTHTGTISMKHEETAPSHHGKYKCNNIYMCKNKHTIQSLISDWKGNYFKQTFPA